MVEFCRIKSPIFHWGKWQTLASIYCSKCCEGPSSPKHLIMDFINYFLWFWSFIFRCFTRFCAFFPILFEIFSKSKLSDIFSFSEKTYQIFLHLRMLWSLGSLESFRSVHLFFLDLDLNGLIDQNFSWVLCFVFLSDRKYQ